MQGGFYFQDYTKMGSSVICIDPFQNEADIGRNTFEGTQIALVTLFERRQLVQTFTLLGVPLTIALTLLTLAFQVLFDLL